MATTNTSMATPDVRDLSAAETADVGGGFFAELFRHLNNQMANAHGEGGQNDPAQMFQQIMQQLTS